MAQQINTRVINPRKPVFITTMYIPFDISLIITKTGKPEPHEDQNRSEREDARAASISQAALVS